MTFMERIRAILRQAEERAERRWVLAVKEGQFRTDVQCWSARLRLRAEFDALERRV